jgi:hypothetical protein
MEQIQRLIPCALRGFLYEGFGCLAASPPRHAFLRLNCLGGFPRGVTRIISGRSGGPRSEPEEQTMRKGRPTDSGGGIFHGAGCSR